jgi:DNA polymerase I-like protein with 3'-5' exonuclease and polymerase domains
MIETSPADRRLAKDIAFCKAYGGGDPHKVMGLSEAEATRIIQAWGDRYPILRDTLRVQSC